MKRCYACKKSKPVAEFNKNNRARSGLQSWCKKCQSDKHREKKALRSEQESPRPIRYMQIEIAKEWRYRYLQAHPCIDCGEKDVRCLDFDHVRGTKLANVSKLVLAGRPIEVIKSEVDKCEVRCANCHRRVTDARRGIPERLRMQQVWDLEVQAEVDDLVKRRNSRRRHYDAHAEIEKSPILLASSVVPL